MIEAKELRIGNLVLDDYGGFMIVKRIDKDELYLKHSSKQFKAVGSYSPVNIKPIKLTEEWLIRFGFIHPMLSCWFKRRLFEVYIQDDIVWFDTLGDSLEIKSVHQLQNLYFALTGEELELKEGE